MKKVAFALIASCFAFLGSIAYAGEAGVDRDILEAQFPTVFRALLNLERIQGGRVADADLPRTLKSPEFNQQYQIEHHKFCADSTNTNNMDCLDPFRNGESVSVSVMDANLKVLSDQDLRDLLDGVRKVVLVVPSADNREAFLEVQREVFARAAGNAKPK